jgi:hypothetical protein
MIALQITFDSSCLFRRAAKFWLRRIEILFEERGCFGVIHMEGVIIIACKGRVLISKGAANAE